MTGDRQAARPRGWAALMPRRLARDSLLRNSFYLTLNTGTQAAIGFVFWVLNARLFSAGQVGIATTIISGATVISLVSLFGVNSTFVRFLPTSQRRDEEINSGVLVVFAIGLLAAALYVGLVPSIVPRLGLIRQSLGFAVGFIVLTAFLAVNIVTDSVFIAFRKAQQLCPPTQAANSLTRRSRATSRNPCPTPGDAGDQYLVEAKSGGPLSRRLGSR